MVLQFHQGNSEDFWNVNKRDPEIQKKGVVIVTKFFSFF